MTVPQFNSTQWFAAISPDRNPISNEQLQPVLEFTLLWSLFERVVGAKFITVEKIRNHVDYAYKSNRLDVLAYRSHLDFLRQKYPSFDQEDYLADRFLSEQRRGSRAELGHVNDLICVLSNQSTDCDDVVFALLFVAYRVRNNLFHGEKDVFTLHLQVDLFRTMNSLLSIYLDQAGVRGRGIV